MTKSKWWWVVAAYATVILIISVIPVSLRVPVPYLDKAVHLCEYLLFAWLLVQAIRANRLHGFDYLLWAWLYASAYGLFIELVQALIPWRSAEWADVLANSVGAALGVWIGQYIPRPFDSPRAKRS